MKIRALHRSIRRSITGSLGRFLSIFSLMVLGVFAFVGLKVSGPDMRATAENFYAEHKLADLTVTSTYGLDTSDQTLIKKVPGIKKVEFGYFRDVLLENTDTSLRVFSTPQTLSTYQVMQGQMPQANDEIALDYLLESHYKLGQKISVSEPKTAGDSVLRNHQFKIVAFVKSSEYVDKSDFGQTNIGTGQLDGYAVVAPKAFKSDVAMIARISYTDLATLSPYAENFTEISNHHQSVLNKALEKQPQQRLSALQANAQSKINDGKAQSDNQATKLRLQEQQLDSEQKQIEQAGLSSSPQSQQLAQAQQKITAAQAEIKANKLKLDAQEAALKQSPLPIYTVSDRKAADPGYQTFTDNSTRIDALANVFPVVLFAISVLVTLTTMTRFVEEERSNLGLLKALGYSNRQIRSKFMIYGLVSSLSGAAVGVVLGHIVLPQVVFNAYTASSTFSNLILKFSPFWTVWAVLIALACTLFPAYIISQANLREVPASLFLAKAPKAGSRILLERLPFLWRHMSFTYKVTARNLFRYKQRMLMTIIGVAGCTALLVMGFGIRDSISGLAQRQFGTILHYDLVAVHQNNLSSSDQKDLDKILSSKQVKQSSAVHYETLTTPSGASKNTQQVSLIVPQTTQNFSSFVTLQNRLSHQKLALANQDIVISEKLATLLKAKVGTTISLKTVNHRTVKLKISAITEMYMGHYLFMNQATYEKIFAQDFVVNADLVKMQNGSDKNVQKLSADLMKNSGMLGISPINNLKDTIDAFLYGINSVMLVLIACAILLAVVVIYNLTNINVAERIRELATIKVLGFYDREVTLYIYRETILLSLIGILAGFGLGAYFHQVIIDMLPTDYVMFNPGLAPLNLLLSSTITLATTLALSLLVHFKLQRIDMLGALKSVD